MRILLALALLVTGSASAATSPSAPPVRLIPGANTTITTNGFNNFTIASAGGGSGAQLGGTNVFTGTNTFNQPIFSANGVVSAGAVWTARTAPTNSAWLGVCYGNGLFVAVAFNGSGNRVMTSPDGVNWTARTEAAVLGWSAVTYGNGLFVAVADSGTGNRVMTSPDGITWTSRTSAADNNWYGLAYGNGLFVAVAYSGTGNRVMTSPDGITWTSRTSAADNNWISVTYGNGLFVAVAVTGTGNRVMTSPDGITWTSRTSAADNSWYEVTYGNGLFVAVAITGTGNRVMTSPDGITWTSRTSAEDNDWTSVTYGNGLFVAVAQAGGGNRVMASLNGVDWVAFAPAATAEYVGIVYGDGLFVSVSYTGGIQTSGKPLSQPFSANNIQQGGRQVLGGLTVGTTGTAISSVLSATAALDFDLTLVDVEDLTVTVTGAALGDTVSLGVPNGSVTATVQYTGWVSATDTVTVRARTSAIGENPASGTFRATVIKF